MNKPNPNWVEASLEEVRWTPELGPHLAREKSKRVEGDEVVVLMEITSAGKVIGTEERRFPRTFIKQNYQSESGIIAPW